MKQLLYLFLSLIFSAPAFSQPKKDSLLQVLQFQKDSALKASFRADSLKIEKEYAQILKWQTLGSKAQFPVLNAGENSLVVPATGITEVPDPSMDYKLLFELVENNPDSVASAINFGLTEVARIINLHVASGIPLKKIQPVIVVHAEALNAFTTNNYYKDRYKMENPNIKTLDELKKLGTKFIACAQAMAFFDVAQADLLPLMKVSLTAQTVLSGYQSKGYVLFLIKTK